MKLLELADEMVFMKKTKSGIMRSFNVACLDDFIIDGKSDLGGWVRRIHNPGGFATTDLNSIEEKSTHIMHRSLNLCFMAKSFLLFTLFNVPI
jgi:hypothetical protein